jgi:hypothetical protein
VAPDQAMRDALERAREATHAFHVERELYYTRYAVDIRERAYRMSHPTPESRAPQEEHEPKARATSPPDERNGRRRPNLHLPPAPEAPNTNWVDRAMDARDSFSQAASEEYATDANAANARMGGGTSG